MTNEEITIMNLPDPPKWEVITPQIAKAYLACGVSNNRHINKMIVNKYKTDIANGNWMATHQGIAFDENGLLIDGQHRLTAIVESGVSVPMLVTRGVERPGLLVIDSGKTRTASDSLKISGYDVVIRSHNAHAFVKQLNVIKFGAQPSKIWTNDEILAELTKYYNLCNFVVYKATHLKNRTRVSAPELVAVFSALASGNVNASAVKAFFYGAYDAKVGPGNYNWQAALVLSREVEKVLFRGGKCSNGPQQDRYEMTERAIYKFANNVSRVNKRIGEEIYPAKQSDFLWLNNNIEELWGDEL